MGTNPTEIAKLLHEGGPGAVVGLIVGLIRTWPSHCQSVNQSHGPTYPPRPLTPQSLLQDCHNAWGHHWIVNQPIDALTTPEFWLPLLVLAFIGGVINKVGRSLLHSVSSN